MIEIQNFSCFDESAKPILDNVSFTIHADDRVCILSDNQEHATIVCHALAGTLKRTYPAHTTNGEITFKGNPVHTIESHHRSELIAYVPPNSDLLISGVKETVFGEIALSLELAGEKPSAIRDKVSDILRKLTIEKLAGRDPDELSGGERHKVALASMIIRKPDILILDNPTMFLDITGLNNLLTILRHYDGAIVIADPNPYAWASFAKRFIVIKQNEIRVAESPEDYIRAINSGEITSELPAWIALYRLIQQTHRLDEIPHTLSGKPYIRKIAGVLE